VRFFSTTGSLALTSCGPFHSSAGAVAELYDISCLFGQAQLDQVADDAIAAWTATSVSPAEFGSLLTEVPNPTSLGQHYFITNPVTGTGINPKWDFTSGAFNGNSNAFIVAAKNSGIPAPTGKQDVDWLYLLPLAGTTGALASEVYRTDTRLGQPPASVSDS
jgi:hypothetical protein